MWAILIGTPFLSWGRTIKLALLLFIALTMQEAFGAIENLDNDIDATNLFIAEKWDQFNRSVDTFFTNRYSPRKNKSSIFAYTSIYQKEGQDRQTLYDFQLKFDLPNTTKRLKIVVEKEQDEISNILSDTSVTNASPRSTAINRRILRTKENRYTAGANFLLRSTKYFASSIHLGLRLDMPLNPNIKFDLKRDLKYKFLNIGLSQKFIVYRQEGFQEFSQVVFNKNLSETLQADFVNSLVWTDETDIFILRNNLVLAQDLGEERGLSYSIGANAKLSPKLYYDSYDASISYRQLLFKNWLYGTLTLGADFIKENHYDDEKFAQVRIEVFFREK